MLSTENFAHQSRALTASALKITPEAEVKLAAKNTAANTLIRPTDVETLLSTRVRVLRKRRALQDPLRSGLELLE